MSLSCKLGDNTSCIGSTEEYWGNSNRFQTQIDINKILITKPRGLSLAISVMVLTPFKSKEIKLIMLNTLFLRFNEAKKCLTYLIVLEWRMILFAWKQGHVAWGDSFLLKRKAYTSCLWVYTWKVGKQNECVHVRCIWKQKLINILVRCSDWETTTCWLNFVQHGSSCDTRARWVFIYRGWRFRFRTV